MTSVDHAPAPTIGGHLLLRVALLCGLSFAAPCLVGCGGAPKDAQGGASSAEDPAPVATAPLLGEATMALLPSSIQVKADDPSSFAVDSFVAALLTQALVEGRSGLRVEPRLDADGATQGYRLGAIAADSPFARLGLQEGDIVGAINGIGMTSPERARAAIASARRQVVVAVERGDTALFLDYRLVDGLAWSSRVREEGGEAAAEEPAVAVVDANALVAAVDDQELERLAADAKAGGRPGAGGGAPPTGAGTGKAIGGSSPSGGKSSGGKSSGKSSGSSPSGGGGKSSGGSGGGGKSSSGGGSGGGSSSASCASADSCTIRRSEVDAVLANPAAASKQVRYTPHISGGKHRGYRLTSVTPGSAVAGLGMRKGDVITSINGHSLTDEGELFALYMGLGGTSTFRINYERGGAKRVKSVRVR